LSSELICKVHKHHTSLEVSIIIILKIPVIWDMMHISRSVVINVLKDCTAGLLG
jgi:hypothetical protein